MSLALIVDGDAEKIALPRQFYADPIVRKGLNGSKVTVDQIVQNTCNLISALSGRGCTKFILIVDREDRSESSEVLEQLLQDKILKKVNASIQVVVADRMFENFLLADIQNISQNFADVFVACANQASYESTHGKSVLKGFLKEGHIYRVENSALYFNKVRTAEAIKNSRSYNRWIEAIRLLGVPYIRRPAN